jgi:hypothetical protein
LIFGFFFDAVVLFDVSGTTSAKVLSIDLILAFGQLVPTITNIAINKNDENLENII